MLRSLESLRLLGSLSRPPRELLGSKLLLPSYWRFTGQRAGVLHKLRSFSVCQELPENLPLYPTM